MKNKKLVLSLLCSMIFISSFPQQFEEQTGIVLPGVTQGSTAWGDYDNDGYPDIFMSGWDGASPVARLYHNNGDNTFSLAGAAFTGVFLGSVAWGDYDNDNDLDILVSGTTTGGTSGAVTKIYRNNGAGIFSEISCGLPGVYYAAVSWSDYNRDGRIDVLLTGMSDGAERICKLFQNNGNGSFTEVMGTPFTGVQYGAHAWGDYDNDGYPDLIISGENGAQERDARFYHNNGNGTFSEITNHPFQKAYYSSVACSDYNGDGLIDVLIAGQGSASTGNTKLYKNLGNNTFSEVSSVSLTGVIKCSVAWADYNDDGKPDIFIAGSSAGGRTFQVYRNCGSDTFCQAGEAITGVQDCSVSIADYDLDSSNDPDIILTGKDPLANPVSKVFRNNCPSTNSVPSAPAGLTYMTSGTRAIISWDRVSGDETPVNSISYNVRIDRTPGKPSFLAGNSTAAGSRKLPGTGNAGLTNSLIHNNLRWDTTYYASVQALDNSFRGGPFSAVAEIKISPVQPSDLIANYISLTSIEVGWTRGNGDKCIVFVKEGSTGSASPANNMTYYANPVFGEGSPIAGGWYCVYKGEADSVLISGLQTQKDYSVHVIEFQGQTGSELYAGAAGQNLAVFSTGLFTNQSGAAMAGLRYSSVSWGDFNNDRFLDALITGLNLAGEGVTKIYQNNANNTFTELPGLTIPGVYHGAVAWGDYNNDGFLDILVTGLNGLEAVSKVYKNNGNSTFTEQSSIILNGVYNSSAAWGDYDNDGDLDIFIAGQGNDAGVSTKVYRNDGNNSFAEQTSFIFPGIRNGAIALGDYDNDGYLDLIMTGFSIGNSRITKIFRNSGGTAFQEQRDMMLPAASLSSVSWGDLDNDGRLDIALSGATGDYPNFNNFTRIFRNNGNNSFSELMNTNLAAISTGTVAWGDYDNDGFLDLLVMGHTGSSYVTRIYKNNGNKTFTDNPYVQMPGFIGCDAKWADYDNDGDLDILVSGYNGAIASRIYKNNTYMFSGDIKANQRPASPTGLNSIVTPGDVRLYWNAVTTDETPVANMSYNVRCRTEDSDNWFYSPQSLENGSRSLVSIGNVQLNKSFNIKNPASGKYYWQVQAVDQGYQGSNWSAVDSFLIKQTQAYFDFDTVCLGIATTFTDRSVVYDGAASWRWNFGDATESALQSPTHVYAVSGTYQVKLRVTSITGIKDSLVRIVLVKAKPSPSFTAPNVCIGLATVLTNTTNLHGLSVSEWDWDFGDGQVSAAQNPGTHNYALSGTYPAKLRVSASNGCSDSLTQNIIVAKYPENTVSVAGDFTTIDSRLTICDGTNLLLTAKNDPLYTYQWQKDSNEITGAEANTFTVSYGSGIYNAKIINTLANCLTVSEQKNINVKPVPAKPVVISDNYKTGECVGEKPVKLKVDQAVGGYQYSWLRNGIPINNSASPVLEDYLDQGDYTVAADLNGCSVKSEKFTVAYQGAPEKPFIYAQGPVKWYLACNNIEIGKYIWFFNDKPIDGAVKYYYVADQNYGVYRVSVGDSKGCYTRSDTIRIPTAKFSARTGSAATVDPLKELKVFPNPSTGVFRIEMNNEAYGEITVSVIGQGGNEVRRTKFIKATTDFSEQVDISGQTPGSYLVNIRLGDNVVTNRIILR